MEGYLDRYKGCWHSMLVLKDEEQGSITDHLTLTEHKGSAQCWYVGTKEGSQKALELVSYLVGMKCVHSYDGVLAGRQA